MAWIKPKKRGRDSVFEEGWKDGEKGRISWKRKLSAVRRENRRMTPGCRRISVQWNRFHAHDAACNKCSWGKEGKNRKKREKEIRERNSQNAPSTRFVPFARSLEIRWFSTRLLESRWYSREGGLEEIRRRIGEQRFFRFCVLTRLIFSYTNSRLSSRIERILIKFYIINRIMPKLFYNPLYNIKKSKLVKEYHT